MCVPPFFFGKHVCKYVPTEGRDTCIWTRDIFKVSINKLTCLFRLRSIDRKECVVYYQKKWVLQYIWEFRHDAVELTIFLLGNDSVLARTNTSDTWTRLYWVQEPLLKPSNWKIANTALEWWINITTTAGMPRKAIRSLALLIMWVLWNERNARIFNRKESSFISVIGKIKEEVSAWIVAGARPLGALLLRD